MPRISENALRPWFGALGAFLEAEVSELADGWRLKGSGDSWRSFVEKTLGASQPEASLRRSPRLKDGTVTIASAPRGPSEWRDRLGLVEKAVAQALTNAPVGFSAIVAAPRSMRFQSAVVRLAFGFSCMLGRRLRKRFTAYVLMKERRAFIRHGGDLLFTLAPAVGRLESSETETRDAIPQLLAAVSQAEEAYRRESAVVAEISRLRHSCEQELRCLNRLYTPTSGQDTRLLGVPTDGLKGDDAVEAEYAARFEDLLDRYRARIIFEPLTIGVVHGWNPEAGEPTSRHRQRVVGDSLSQSAIDPTPAPSAVARKPFPRKAQP
jgi:hypothetical protein